MRSALRLAGALTATFAALLVGAYSSAHAAATWDSRQVAVGDSTGDSLFGVSCPTASLCVAVGNRGTIVTSESPSGAARAWRSETVAPGSHVGPGGDRTSPGSFEAVSCPSAWMCAAVSYAGDLYASANPAAGAATWRPTDLDGTGPDTHLKGIDCPTPTLCAAVASGTPNETSGGRIISVRDPLSPSVFWVATQLDPSINLQAVSCPNAGFCIAVAENGRVVTSGSPFAAAPVWRELNRSVGPGGMESVDCPGASFCLAGNAAGNILSSGNADAVSPRWRKANAGPSVPITGISCPATSLCAGVTNNGDVLASTDPSGPTGSWSATNLIPFPIGGDGLPYNALFSISCPSAALCAAVGSRGTIFTSGNPFDIDEVRGPRARPRGPRRPRMKILRSDHFGRQSRTRGSGSRVTFRLRPYGRARGFLCRLDRRRFRRCSSPLRIYASVGHHVLRARAIGVNGLRGPVTKHRFAIQRMARRGGVPLRIERKARPDHGGRGGPEPWLRLRASRGWRRASSR